MLSVDNDMHLRLRTPWLRCGGKHPAPSKILVREVATPKIPGRCICPPCARPHSGARRGCPFELGHVCAHPSRKTPPRRGQERAARCVKDTEDPKSMFKCLHGFRRVAAAAILSVPAALTANPLAQPLPSRTARVRGSRKREVGFS